jgi:hypothetical protein
MDSASPSRPFPGYSHVYRLLEPGTSRAFRASLEMTHEEALSVLRGEAADDAPIRAQWAMGASKPADVIWTTLALPVLISERVLGILRERRFSGWDVAPVELRGRTGEILPRYYFMRVRGHCGPIEYDRSEKGHKIYPGGTFPVWKGLYFDPATWDGSDLFMAEGAGFKFAVEAVRDAVQNANVKNILFEPVDEVELESLK